MVCIAVKRCASIALVLAVLVVAVSGKIDLEGNELQEGKKHALFMVKGNSHLVPVLPLADELFKNGHRVTFWTVDTPDTLERFGFQGDEKQNLKLLSVRSLFSYYDAENRMKIVHRGSQCHGVGRWSMFLHENWNLLISYVREVNPDVIVYDSVLNGDAKFIGLHLGIPTFSSLAANIEASYTAFQEGRAMKTETRTALEKTMHRQANMWIAAKGWLHRLSPKMFSSMLKRLLLQSDVKEPHTFDDPNLHGLIPLNGSDLAFSQYTLVHSSFEVEEQNYKAMIEAGEIKTKYIFVGRDLQGLGDRQLSEEEKSLHEKIKEFANGKKLIHVTFGTWNNHPMYLNRAIVESLNGWENVRVIMAPSSGGQKYKSQDEVREAMGVSVSDNNFFLQDRVSLSLNYRIIKMADALVTHMGYNTFLEALFAGTPMLALPVKFDQPANGRTLERLERGYVMGEEWEALLGGERTCRDFLKDPEKAKVERFKTAFSSKLKQLVNSEDIKKMTDNETKKYVDGVGVMTAMKIVLGEVSAEDYVGNPTAE